MVGQKDRWLDGHIDGTQIYELQAERWLVRRKDRKLKGKIESKKERQRVRRKDRQKIEVQIIDGQLDVYHMYRALTKTEKLIISYFQTL